MTNFQVTVLSIIKGAITSSFVELPEINDWKLLLTYGKNNGIIPLIYYGLINSNLNVPAEVKSEMETDVFKSIFVNSNQFYCISKIEEKFKQNKIDYMLLKGIILKKLYPRAEMRTMGDADILIRMEQYEKIKLIMNELGYKNVKISDHDFSWSKPNGLYVELHRRLIPSYNKDYHSYYGDAWGLAHKSENCECRYVMTNEDTFVYLFTHFSKHYRDAGIGISHILDIWIYKNNVELDEEYINAQFKKLQLDTFYNNIMYTLAVWFQNAISNRVVEQITDTIFNSSAFGLKEISDVSLALRAKVDKKNTRKYKLTKFFHQLFPTGEGIKFKYPILGEKPFLLPFFWIARWMEILFLKFGKVKEFYKRTTAITDDRVFSYGEQLKSVGLGFNFEEKERKK